MIYFLCHGDPANYQWDIIPLAEGLEMLGVPFCGSADYWRRSDGTFLIQRRSGIDPLSADAVVVSTGYLNWWREGSGFECGVLPEWFKKDSPRRARLVALDVSDGYLSPITGEASSQFDIVLRSHFNSRLWWPDNVRPWAFGLTNRIISYGKNYAQSWEKRSGALFAFGASHGYRHTARDWADSVVRPLIEQIMHVDSSQEDLAATPNDAVEYSLWKQCRQRHSADFFRRLGGAKICATFCGDLVPALPSQPRYLVGGKKARLFRDSYKFISAILGLDLRNVQPDSWRFWETLGSGTVAINFDFEQSGWRFPIQPCANVEYVAVPLRGDRGDMQRLLRNDGALQEIAEGGMSWAHEHYSPKMVATRFLENCAK